MAGRPPTRTQLNRPRRRSVGEVGIHLVGIQIPSQARFQPPASFLASDRGRTWGAYGQASAYADAAQPTA